MARIANGRLPVPRGRGVGFASIMSGRHPGRFVTPGHQGHPPFNGGHPPTINHPYPPGFPTPGQPGHPPFNGGNPPGLNHPHPPHPPNFPTPGHPGHPPFNGGNPPTLQTGGYTGLGNIISILQKGINQQQLNNLAAGATGTHATGVIGGMHGAFQGLTPAAVHYLATSGLLSAVAPHLQDTSGLAGDDLFKAQLMNNLMQQQAQANPTYTLHSGVDASYLTNLLGNLPGAYRSGFGAAGRVAGPVTA